MVDNVKSLATFLLTMIQKSLPKHQRSFPTVLHCCKIRYPFNEDDSLEISMLLYRKGTNVVSKTNIACRKRILSYITKTLLQLLRTEEFPCVWVGGYLLVCLFWFFYDRATSNFLSHQKISNLSCDDNVILGFRYVDSCFDYQTVTIGLGVMYHESIFIYRRT